MKDKMFVIRMDQETKNQLIHLANQTNKSRAGVIRDLILLAAKNFDRKIQPTQAPKQPA